MDRIRSSLNDHEFLGKRIMKHGYVTIHSDLLNLDFRCPVNDYRAPRLEYLVSAHEELARQRTIKPRKR